MLFWYNLDFLKDQNQEEFQKKWREATENQRMTKIEEFIFLVKISQGKKSPCEKRVFLRKNFASQRAILRKGGYLAKIGSSCEKISHPKVPQLRTTSRHTCAISQPQSPFRSFEMSYETPQSIISQAKAPSCETTSKHTCTIFNLKSPFRSYKMSYETTCEIPL